MDIETPDVFFKETTRFWMQRVLVPILVLIGVSGNVVTVMVLTRRRMRCTTNIYLTALAVADVVYLFFVLLLSFKHYPHIHDQRYELYWRFNGILHWFCDAASNTSVWLTVSFTLERYIAVCHPIKGKVLCTENRAKSIIAIISILCIVASASTTFEHQLNIKKWCNETTPCENLVTHENQKLNNNQTGNTTFCGVFLYIPFHNSTSLKNSVSLEIPRSLPVDFLKMQNYSSVPVILVPCSFIKSLNNHLPIESKNYFNRNTDSADTEDEDTYQIRNIKDDSSALVNSTLQMENNGSATNSTCCVKSFWIGTEMTTLGKDKTYTTVFYWFTAIAFSLLPLVLIATFNCFLIRALYESRKMRSRMTNSQESTSQSNENRITLILVGVVVMFLVCQTPTAAMCIYDPISSDDEYTQNIKLGLGNIFNFLVTINAACNFLLYCVLSHKYRSTFRKLFCERRINRQDTLALSLTRSRNSQKFNPNSSTFKRNATYGQTPRNLEYLVETVDVT